MKTINNKLQNILINNIYYYYNKKFDIYIYIKDFVIMYIA